MIAQCGGKRGARRLQSACRARRQGMPAGGGKIAKPAASCPPAGFSAGTESPARTITHLTQVTRLEYKQAISIQ